MFRRTAFSLFAACALAAAQPAATADEVNKAEAAWIQAVVKNDIKALDQMLANDLVYSHSSGVVETKQEYLGKLKTGDQKYATIERSNQKTQTYANTGIVTGPARMTGATKGVPFDNKLLMIHVWVKQGGRWQLAAHQTTRLNP
jgi:ketosteroid isomerase-like protein